MTYKEYKEQGGTLTEKEFDRELEEMTAIFNRDEYCHLMPEELSVKVINGNLWVDWS